MTRQWRSQAACLGEDPDLWFQTLIDGKADVAAAKAICATCPVTKPCLEEVLTREGMAGSKYRPGVWGALDGAEREQLAVPRGRSGEPPPCGTPGAYRMHQRRGEPKDDACKLAWSQHKHGVREAAA